MMANNTQKHRGFRRILLGFAALALTFSPIGLPPYGNPVGIAYA